jgi:hypothetical protein
MSEERRKRQQERDPQPAMTRKILLWIGILILFILFAATYLAGRYYRNYKSQQYAQSHKYDAFAKCLASKQAKMYGLYWCPHCKDQKEMFGASFQYVPYVECAIKGSHEMAPECKDAGVKLFPSWQFGTDPPKEGVLSLDALSEKTGCSLP